ncbi:MAG TPA: DUF5710 domain-containing protein [Sporichthyaceae bacterium]|nr:DUF5710 domain-containing protein [Sporichthyaceae bacterium]
MSAVELPGGGQVVGARRRVWLDVAYAENAAAKAAGARWDGGARRWYAPAGLTTVLARWAVRPPIPELLPGEDRTFGGGLFIDPVPTSCWFTNARSCISGGDWERVRRMVTGRAKHRCEVCAAAADRDVGRWLEVHERWEYIAGPGQPVGTQVLRRLICLCTPCHTATHFGLAQLRGRANEAFAHLCKVTGMSADEAAAHLDGAGATWMARNRRTWNLDLRILTVAGIALATSPEAAHRADIADTETLRARRPG